MLLSRLEISGFKSFPNKTIIDFDGGITGVVGPNGCGKSNILDSIRWVLGEQRTSVLRSSRMEEVIFSGTSQLKPIGMAEVNLFIKNNRGLLPIEYDEVSITRRLYRSGESEYLLNKNQCRLRDIVELFLDTGIGPHAYSVIQQGMVDAILSDKTEDRRSLFEEAAGVTKYKHRKKEAENKLEATEADLLRLGDIIAEIEKQVILLRRQAKWAQRYGKQKELLKDIECSLASAQLFDSQKRYNDLLQNKKDRQINIEASNTEIGKFEFNLQEEKLKLTDHETRATEHRQSESDVTIKSARLESDIRLNKQHAETSSNTIENCKVEIDSLEKRIQQLENEISENRLKLKDVDTQKESSEKENKTIEAELERLSRESTEAESALGQQRTKHSGITERISGIRAEAESIRGMNDGLDQKIAELDSASGEYDKFRSQNRLDVNNLEEKKQGIIKEIETSKLSRNSKSKEIADLEESLGHLKDKLSSLRSEFSGLSARKELLEQLIESGEGYSGGAKALLSWSEKPAGMLLPLAEAMEVREDYRVAVTAALGQMGEVIPVRRLTEAESAIEYLKASGGGRASFLVLEDLDESEFSDNRPEAADGFLGYLDALVDHPEEYRPAVKLLLSRVALFKSKDVASNIDGKWQHFTRVALDGTLYMPAGFVSGGKTIPTVIGRKQDSDSIKTKLKALTSEIETGEAELNLKHSKMEESKTEFKNIQHNIESLEEDRSTVESESSRLKFDSREKENRYEAAADEIEKLKKEIAHYGEKLDKLDSELKECESESSDSSATLERMSDRAESLRNSTRDIETRLTAARIKNVELDGLTAKLNSETEHRLELCSEATKMIAANRDNIIQAQQVISETRAKDDELKQALEDCFDDQNKVKEKLNIIEGAISELMSNSKRLEDELAGKRKVREQQTSALHQLDMELMEFDSSRKSILERLQLEFGVSSIEPAPLPEGTSVESQTQKNESIRNSLQRMEPVNLMAAEDYERENDRLEFLLRQREDLIEAKTSLKQAITRINTTAEERFGGTFEKINENFRQVFVSLFEGGEAGVELEDPSDPLESPIRIWARPHGKRMLSVTQLSGGERALTAISLLFAIYLVKPSPFCILDEIDAPLDDANLLRFLKLIKEYAKGTQFIIITHNKLTMEASDILYGVTMQSPGVSKVVAVKFGDNGDGDEQ